MLLVEMFEIFKYIYFFKEKHLVKGGGGGANNNLLTSQEYIYIIFLTWNF
jgi:hypothetical protein